METKRLKHQQKSRYLSIAAFSALQKSEDNARVLRLSYAKKGLTLLLP